MDSSRVYSDSAMPPELVSAAMMLFGLAHTMDFAPVVFFAVREDGVPCAVFHGAFTQADADSIGDLLTNQLEEITLNHPM